MGKNEEIKAIDAMVDRGDFVHLKTLIKEYDKGSNRKNPIKSSEGLEYAKSNFSKAVLNRVDSLIEKGDVGSLYALSNLFVKIGENDYDREAFEKTYKRIIDSLELLLINYTLNKFKSTKRGEDKADFLLSLRLGRDKNFPLLTKLKEKFKDINLEIEKAHKYIDDLLLKLIREDKSAFLYLSNLSRETKDNNLKAYLNDILSKRRKVVMVNLEDEMNSIYDEFVKKASLTREKAKGKGRRKKVK